MNFRGVIEVLVRNGFQLARQKGSHRIYKGVVGGQMRLVVVSAHRESDDVKPGTLASIVRQSGLPKRLFRLGS
ncbi:MAG: addiction module toxin, HicA family [Rhodospirillales bacterium]|nr:addiction module toxin, HicA family [Rhodospirillales bacterium]